MTRVKRKEYAYFILKDGIKGVSWCAESLKWIVFNRPIFYFTLKSAKAAFSTIPKEERKHCAIHRYEFLNDLKKLQEKYLNHLNDEIDEDYVPESMSDFLKRMLG